MKYAPCLLTAALLAVAASRSDAAVYLGVTTSSATYHVTGNLVGNNQYLGSYADADLELTIQDQKISFAPGPLAFAAQSYSGTRTLVDPATFQSKNFSYSFSTSAVDLVLPATAPASLFSSGGGVSWNMAEGNPAATFLVSGTYTVSGPTETFSGTFSHLAQVDALQSSGTLTANEDGSLNLFGTIHYNFPSSTDTTVLNRIVDGIPVSVFLSNYVQVNLSGVYTVPEPTAAGLAILGSVLLLRPRRRSR
jgi:hypothetical protein